MIRSLVEILTTMGSVESENSIFLNKILIGFTNYKSLDKTARRKLVLESQLGLGQIKNITIFDLIENAKESLDHAIDHFTKTTPSLHNDLKRVLLDITHVVELLLKERLQRINPALIWKNVDQFPDERSETVSPKIAFERLQKIGGLPLTETTKKEINDVTELRNKIVHYKFRIEEKGVHVIIGKILSFILDFSTSHLSLDWEEEFKQSPKWKMMMQDRDLWNVHKPVVENRMILTFPPRTDPKIC